MSGKRGYEMHANNRMLDRVEKTPAEQVVLVHRLIAAHAVDEAEEATFRDMLTPAAEFIEA